MAKDATHPDASGCRRNDLTPYDGAMVRAFLKRWAIDGLML
jgi:hypothetical protein